MRGQGSDHLPRLLSADGRLHITSDPGEWLEKAYIEQAHSAPGHPQPQGKIAC